VSNLRTDRTFNLRNNGSSFVMKFGVGCAYATAVA